ncbi:MAG TPA: hypothetical protein VM285_07040 [Polyangia bacterium]|nr:hypothetical protein [Polyangia bacterium]
MTLEQAVRALQNLPAEKQEVVARLIQILAEPGEKAESRAPIPSFRGIAKHLGSAPSLQELREARRECWNFDRAGSLP